MPYAIFAQKDTMPGVNFLVTLRNGCFGLAQYRPEILGGHNWPYIATFVTREEAMECIEDDDTGRVFLPLGSTETVIRHIVVELKPVTAVVGYHLVTEDE